MPLLAYNKTGSPITIFGTKITVPKSPSPPSNGPGVNVTSELRPNLTVDPINGITNGLSAATYTTIAAQTGLTFAWTTDPEYDTAGLTPQNNLVHINSAVETIKTPKIFDTTVTMNFGVNFNYSSIDPLGYSSATIGTPLFVNSTYFSDSQTNFPAFTFVADDYDLMFEKSISSRKMRAIGIRPQNAATNSTGDLLYIQGGDGSDSNGTVNAAPPGGLQIVAGFAGKGSGSKTGGSAAQAALGIFGPFGGAGDIIGGSAAAGPGGLTFISSGLGGAAGAAAGGVGGPLQLLGATGQNSNPNAGGASAMGGTGLLQGGTGGSGGMLPNLMVTSTLNGSINSSVTTILLASTGTFPSSGVALINNEFIIYTGVSGNNLTGVIRGANGTTAASHTNGAAVIGYISIFPAAINGANGQPLTVRGGRGGVGYDLTGICGVGAALNLLGGTGGLGYLGADGAPVNITGGGGTGLNGSGKGINITGGANSTTGVASSAGLINITGGKINSGSAKAGSVNIVSGQNAGSGDSGDINININSVNSGSLGTINIGTNNHATLNLGTGGGDVNIGFGFGTQTTYISGITVNLQALGAGTVHLFANDSGGTVTLNSDTTTSINSNALVQVAVNGAVVDFTGSSNDMYIVGHTSSGLFFDTGNTSSGSHRTISLGATNMQILSLGNASATIGAFGQAGTTRPTVTGSRTTGAAYGSLLDAMAALGWVIDSSTA